MSQSVTKPKYAQVTIKQILKGELRNDKIYVDGQNVSNGINIIVNVNSKRYINNDQIELVLEDYGYSLRGLIYGLDNNDKKKKASQIKL